MAVYMLLTSLTDAGRKIVEEQPERLKDFNKEMEYMGVKILTQYALLGPYDFVNIVEGSGDEFMARLAIHLSAGGIFQTMTLAAIPLDNLIAALKKKSTPL